ncbi:MAG: hypothetical protein PHP57_00185 [Sideroxydans sp.]|nr:hypothetical protein [Sideroxydans sp.]
MKKSVFWIGVLFLVFVFISATRFGVAELLSISARSEMDSWGKKGLAPTTADVESVGDRIQWAIRFADVNPSHHEDAARLSLMRALLPNVSPAEKSLFLKQGVAEIQTSLHLRPISAYSWVIFLSLKRELNEYDDEFRHALHRAVELGPWESELIVALADIGLSAWDKMPAAEQAIIQQVFVRGMRRNQNQLNQVSRAHREAACAQKAGACQ